MNLKQILYYSNILIINIYSSEKTVYEDSIYSTLELVFQLLFQ